MKKLLIYSSLFLATSVVFFSCKKDKDSIIGTWKTTSQIDIEYENGVKVSEDIKTFTDADAMIITFNKDNTYNSKGGGDTDSGTYSVDNEYLTITPTNSGFSPGSLKFKYTLNKNDLKYGLSHENGTNKSEYILNLKRQ